MPQVLRSDLAELDPVGIWEFVAMNNVAAADQLLRTIGQKCELIATRPTMGRPRDSLPDLRSHLVGNYVVFYRPIADGVEIVRVLHGARDIETAFAEPANHHA